ncbi:MAG: class I SAM-dependent methyltransferase [Candidatus Absconditabacterales bacterium]|nr:class I SAM-dependent methyltransferase [Candidatus Absconditabacterales bacterium]
MIIYFVCEVLAICTKNLIMSYNPPCLCGGFFSCVRIFMRNVLVLVFFMTLDKTYSAVAHHFSQTRKKHWPEMDRIVRIVASFCPVGASIVDLGCGDGRLLAALDKVSQEGSMNRLLQGVDFADGFVSLARSHLPHLSIHHTDMLVYLSSQDAHSLDCVVFLASFHHLLSQKDQQVCLYHLARVLKPGGLVCMVNWSMSPWFRKKYAGQIMLSVLRSLVTLGIHDWRCISIPYRVGGVSYPREYYLHDHDILCDRCLQYGLYRRTFFDETFLNTRNMCLAFGI